MSETIIDMLFTIIRAAFGIRVDGQSISPDDLCAVEQIASRQSILYIVITGLKNMGRVDLLTDSMKVYEPKAHYDFIQRKESLKEISSAFCKSGIEYIPLKGSFLRDLYPDPSMRTSSDIDVLVKEKDIERASSIVEEQTSFSKNGDNYHNVSFLNRRVHLELHFSIKENDENTDQLLSKAWDFTRKTEQDYHFTFTPEYEIFYTLAHMKHHFLNGGLGIRPFLDLWLLRNKTQYSETQVEEYMSKCGISKFYKECCHLSEVWMGCEEHTDTSRKFEAFCLAGGVFGNEQFRVAARQRNKRGWKYLLSRAFPPQYQVREYYRDNSGKEHSTAYYYLKRWRRWLSKERRNELKDRVNKSLKSDKNYQDSADDLFERLGL